jgi:hypothetical protein
MSKTLPPISAFAVTVIATSLASQSAPAQTEPNAIERFVAAVQSGADLSKGEFAGLVKPEDAARLAKVAACKPGAPRTSDSDSAILVMWDCSAQPGASSLGTMFDVSNGKITSVFVMSAVVAPVRPQ